MLLLFIDSFSTSIGIGILESVLSSVNNPAFPIIHLRSITFLCSRLSWANTFLLLLSYLWKNRTESLGRFVMIRRTHKTLWLVAQVPCLHSLCKVERKDNPFWLQRKGYSFVFWWRNGHLASFFLAMSFELVVSIGRIGSISINELSIQSFLRFSRLSAGVRIKKDFYGKEREMLEDYHRCCY